MHKPCSFYWIPAHLIRKWQSDKSISLNVDLEEHCDVGGDSRPTSVWWRGHSCEIREQEQQDECLKRLCMVQLVLGNQHHLAI